MVLNIKAQIKDLAKNAVLVAEQTLGSGNGQKKKKMAIEYIVNNLPFSNLVKNLISIFLSKFIDDVVEISVKYMNTITLEKGE